MSSFIAKPAEVERKWYVVDAEGKNLGRMASQIAAILRGKNKPTYTPHVDCGDYVIVINAEKVEVTGKKRKEKIYKRHTGYPGGLREMTFEQMMEKHPTEVVRHAGNGNITVNKKSLDDYLSQEIVKREVKRPFEIAGCEGKFDVIATVHGGGYTGQAGALRHGISRALCEADREAYRPALKAAGFLTRDSRMKERKKYGLKKARRASQFSKR